jgi:hypothetical protein
MTTWLPISTAPRDKTYVLVAGDSGYTTTPLRVEVCRYDSDFRPLNPWVNHSDDSFTDGGPPPRWWMPLPPLPVDYGDDNFLDERNGALAIAETRRYRNKLASLPASIRAKIAAGECLC